MAEAYRRDRIVILGRPGSGKSVYLAVLYQQLWTSESHISIRAADGVIHSALLGDSQSLAKGQWLPATQALRHFDLIVNYGSQSIPLTVLDYPGELYRRLFFENKVEGEELQQLFDHVAHALGVIMLIDPADVVSDGEAGTDTEFSALQVVEHFRSGQNGRELPLVLVYTKKDENAGMIKDAGGLARFTRIRMPRLTRMLRGVPIVHLSAVRATPGKDGERKPSFLSTYDQVVAPLKLILDRINQDTVVKQAKHGKRVRRYKSTVLIVIVALLMCGAGFAIGIMVGS